MKSAFVALLAVVLLAGCGEQLVISDQGDSDISVASRDALATQTAQAITPFPTLAPTAPFLDDPTDPLTIVLGGLYGKGGYWTWDEIANLLGVYAEYDAYTTTTVDGVDYTGVPLPYLLRFAELSQTAQATTVLTRDGQRIPLNTSRIRDCMDCLIVRADDGTLTLVVPEVQPYVIRGLVRLDSG